MQMLDTAIWFTCYSFEKAESAKHECIVGFISWARRASASASK